MRFVFVVCCLLGAGCRDDAKEFEQLAEQACACDEGDTACGTQVLAGVVKFAETHGTSHSDQGRINQAGARLHECLINTGVKPNELTAALERM